ncbi:MAG: succinate dehydrogenase, hydrophobic membrane anchor protein [Pseudomonadota bacterium]
MSASARQAATGHWLIQRVSAVMIMLLGGWFIATLLGLTGLENMEYASVKAFFSQPINAALIGLLTVTLAYHSSLGIQVVLEDYVHDRKLNRVSLRMSQLAHSLVALACVVAIVRIGMIA